MEIKKVKKITPRFNHVITTADRGGATRSGIITLGADQSGLHPIQKIVAVGPFVKDPNLKEGAVVRIDLTQYGRTKYEEGSIKSEIEMNPVVEYNVPTIMLDGKQFLYISDNAISYVIDEYE